MIKFLLMFFLLCSTCYAADTDRVRIQVQFKQAVWTCPICGQEDIEDRSMSGGDSYVHTCSKCSAQFNQSGSNMREYNGSINLTPQEYETTDSKELADLKSEKVSEWLYQVKNPPPYVEPTKEDIERIIADKQSEIDILTTQKADIEAKEIITK